MVLKKIFSYLRGWLGGGYNPAPSMVWWVMGGPPITPSCTALAAGCSAFSETIKGIQQGQVDTDDQNGQKLQGEKHLSLSWGFLKPVNSSHVKVPAPQL